jgi:acetyl-CoA acetyltransferase
MSQEDRAVIAGIGNTDYSAESGRTEAVLAIQAITAAMADANLPIQQIDGFVAYVGDTTPETALQRNFGLPQMSYTGRVVHGGGDMCSTILQAKLVVEARVARVVVIYRAFNERSGARYGRGYGVAFGSSSFGPTTETDQFAMVVPFGLRNAAGWMAMFAQRYLSQYGATSADFANVTVSARKHAANNPAARFFGRPITVEDHQASRLIVEPLHLLDCCLETDGGVAIVVTSEATARAAESRYVHIGAVASGSGTDQQMMTSYYRPDILRFEECEAVANQLWAATGLGPRDIDAAMMYDHFTPMVFAQLESYGFCARGEAKDFTKAGNIELGGTLPVNTHGGQLGEAYMHGLNGVIEAVRQLRGVAINQVSNADIVLVSSPPGTAASGMILTKVAL